MKCEKEVKRLRQLDKKAQYTLNWDIDNRERGIFNGIMAELYSD